MTIDYCDICGANLRDCSPLVTCGSRSIFTEGQIGKPHKLLLCGRCYVNLFYYLENKDEIEQINNKLSLVNRIKFLFKKKDMPRMKVVNKEDISSARFQATDSEYRKGWNDAIDTILNNAPEIDVPCWHWLEDE